MKNSILQPGMDEVTVVFAHPDDELLYFYQLLQSLQPRHLRLVCVTGRFSREGEQALRLPELARAAEHLGGELINFGLEDRLRQPLDTQALLAKLKRLKHSKGSLVFTHGPVGEYGHRHHVAVFKAVLQCFGNDTWCVSGPLEANFICSLTPAQAKAKREVIERIYVSQTVQKYATEQERFTHVCECCFADVLLSVCGGTMVTQERAAIFLEHIERAYFSEQTSLPIEAWTAANIMGFSNVEQRIRTRIDEWQELLGQPSDVFL